MNKTTLSAGDTIDSKCTRCRAVTNHTIVAMVGDRVARVECNTCGGVHNYREAKPAEKPAAKATRKTAAPRWSRKDPAAADREKWTALRPSMESDRALPYDMNGQYKAKNLIDHPVFGLGVVQEVAGPRKIEVLFECGKKLLRCG
jgi:hypothetical protein